MIDGTLRVYRSEDGLGKLYNEGRGNNLLVCVAQHEGQLNGQMWRDAVGGYRTQKQGKVCLTVELVSGLLHALSCCGAPDDAGAAAAAASAHNARKRDGVVAAEKRSGTCATSRPTLGSPCRFPDATHSNATASAKVARAVGAVNARDATWPGPRCSLRRPDEMPLSKGTIAKNDASGKMGRDCDFC